jgi:hypothetical protein
MTNQVAQTISKQIGGGAFTMIGAKNLLDHGDALSFRIGRNSKSVNYVKVTLTPADLYDVEYGYIRGTTYKVRSNEQGIYADMLRESIERNTGLYTSL